MKKILIILSIPILFIACNHVSDERQAWPGGKIPFIMIGFTPEEEFEIVKAMITWECASDGKVEFFFYGTRETDNKPLYILKNEMLILSSGIGYNPNNKNIMMLADYEQGIDQRSILHELAHILGIIHEFNRPDRDLFVNVDLSNIYSGSFINTQFIYEKPELYNYQKYPFDYKSITMYSRWECGEILKSLDGEQLGGDSITWIDAWKVRDIYSEQSSCDKTLL